MSNEENKIKVSSAFSNQSASFDRIYTGNLLSEYMRSKFREELLCYLNKTASILELNCGTGMDTVYLAQLGYHITATDNSEGMLEQIRSKVRHMNLENRIQVRRCDFEHLSDLLPGQFDHIYSNFSGLNCTPHLDKVLLQMGRLLSPGGKISIVVMPKICPWENMMLFKGKFRTAFRRFSGKAGTDAHIEGVQFKTWYYNPSYILKALKKDFRLLSLKGISITVPPPFIEDFVERYPRVYAFLCAVDKKIEKIFPFNHCCDQYMITLQSRR